MQVKSIAECSFIFRKEELQICVGYSKLLIFIGRGNKHIFVGYGQLNYITVLSFGLKFLQYSSNPVP